MTSAKAQVAEFPKRCVKNCFSTESVNRYQDGQFLERVAKAVMTNGHLYFIDPDRLPVRLP